MRSQIEAGDDDKIVAIAIETGDFEVNADEIAICDLLKAHHVDAQIWIVRIDSRYVRRFDGYVSTQNFLSYNSRLTF